MEEEINERVKQRIQVRETLIIPEPKPEPKIDSGPAVPQDVQLKNRIDAMAVRAIEKPEMVEMVREKKADDPAYGFLQAGGEGQEYYDWCVQRERLRVGE